MSNIFNNTTSLQSLLETLKTKSDNSPSITPSVLPNDVNFYDYDGTLLYSYTLDEIQTLIKLPPLPVHEGLHCQEWNYNLETIKSYNRAVNVGATYITDDGKTRLYIRIATEYRMTILLNFVQTIANGIIVDWGDGSFSETLSNIGEVSIAHTYTSIGDYVITLEATNGCILELGHRTNRDSVIQYESIKINESNRLQKIEIGSNVTNILPYSMNHEYSLASITIPNNVTSIGENAFSCSLSLTNIIIPNNVTSIGQKAFESCALLTNVIIPNSVTSIGDYAFYHCNIKKTVIPNSVINIGHTVYGLNPLVDDIIIPNSLTDVEYILSNCESQKSVTIPNSVTSIGDYAFYHCFSLINVEIPNSVTSIGIWAFGNCTSLTSIEIPNSVTSIDKEAFIGCINMACYDFTSHTSIPILSNTNAFSGIPSDCIIKVPAALYDEWIAATNWSTYASQIVAV